MNPRELLLLRHGKSDWNMNVDDYDRPLKDRGKRGAQRIGVWLLKNQLIPDYIVTSPAERALVTAEKACKAMGKSSKILHKKKQLYEASLKDFLQVLGKCPNNCKRVLLVGHNPGLEVLLTHLANKRIPLPEDARLLPTATLARLEMPNSWQKLPERCAKLLTIQRATELPKGFPFPDYNSSELRKRPAYYYTQSSVIPYRFVDGTLRILVISSSNNKHLVIPKGIKDPGLSPQASAAKEAKEEAGVEGTVAEQAIGRYLYQKWGATCAVEVFPMRVTRVIPEAEWEEEHRGREWMDPESAANKIKQPELKPMLKILAEHLKNN